MPNKSTSAPGYDDPSWGRFALSRSCALTDFPACHSAAEWQQQLAMAAWDRLRPSPFAPAPLQLSYTLNWSGCQFESPGTSAPMTGGVPEGALTAIFALSVLDRIEAPARFLSQSATRLVLGGIVACTFAAWNASGPDTATGHEIRKRIYTWEQRAMRRFIDELQAYGLVLFGGVEWRYHGDQLGDHTLASLVLAKTGDPR